MRRKAARALAALCAVALSLSLFGCSGGWGAVARSAADRLLPYPEETLWAPSPSPDSFVDSYDDATGAGRNYVYLVDAADEDGVVREVQLIFFGAKSDGEDWLEIGAKGGSGVRYRAVAESSIPPDAIAAVGRGCYHS